ncbi:MAG: hypothetical protein ACQEV0_08885 [Bacillota bacterium]
MDHEESSALRQEIEKLKFHNRTLMTWIGNMLEDKSQALTIHEAIVMHDLSKEDLQCLERLISGFNGDISVFEQLAKEVNPTFTKASIVGILQAFIVSGVLEEKSREILRFY